MGASSRPIRAFNASSSRKSMAMNSMETLPLLSSQFLLVVPCSSSTSLLKMIQSLYLYPT